MTINPDQYTHSKTLTEKLRRLIAEVEKGETKSSRPERGFTSIGIGAK